MTTTTAAASYSSTNLGQKAIEQAARQNKVLFSVYMVLLVGTAIFTYLLWRSGNVVQEAIVADADARIAEANSNAASAQERATKLEHDNLALRSDLANLQKQAATQQERAAKAERALEELKEAMRSRSLTPNQQTDLVNLLNGDPKGTVAISTVQSNAESFEFAHQISGVLKTAGWAIKDDGVIRAIWTSGEPTGNDLIIGDVTKLPTYAERLYRAFVEVGLPLRLVRRQPGSENDTVEIRIGHKLSGA